MKAQNLDIEKIGGLAPMKKSEEKLVSDYLKQKSSKTQNLNKKKSKPGLSQKID